MADHTELVRVRRTFLREENLFSLLDQSLRDQDHEIMVYALRQVISSHGGDTSSSNWIASEAFPPPDAGPCPLCGATGCYGFAFPRPEEIKKEKKHRGVRKKPSGKWSAEIWDPSMKVRRWLGTFPTYEMAVHAYEEADAALVGRRLARRGTNSGEGASTMKTVVEMTEKDFGRRSYTARN